MKPTLHLIANCTSRKHAAVSDLLRLRSVPPGTLEERASSWCGRLKQSPAETILAGELYAGGHWTAIQRLEPLVEQAGFEARVWIISAGYGLVSACAGVRPYSATFSGSHPDAVTTSVTEKHSRKTLLQKWWKALTESRCVTGKGPRSLTSLARSAPRDYFLVVASPDYLSAVGDDLQTAATRLASPDRLLIVSSGGGQKDDPLGQFVIPSSARLQPRVGGARTSLNARVAALVLKKVATCGFNPAALRKQIRDITARSVKSQHFVRTRANDDDVAMFIRVRMDRTERSSFSSLLKEFRDGGRACEANRFKSLYYEVKENFRET